MHAAINASFRPRSLQAASKIPSFGSPHGLTRMTPAWLVALASSLLGATTADFRSVLEGPGPARNNGGSAFSKALCGGLAVRRSGVAPPIGKRAANSRIRSAVCARQSVSSTTASLFQAKPKPGTRPLRVHDSLALPCRRLSRIAPKANACSSGCMTKAPSASGSAPTWRNVTASRRPGCSSRRPGSGQWHFIRLAGS